MTCFLFKLQRKWFQNVQTCEGNLKTNSTHNFPVSVTLFEDSIVVELLFVPRSPRHVPFRKLNNQIWKQCPSRSNSVKLTLIESWTFSSHPGLQICPHLIRRGWASVLYFNVVISFWTRERLRRSNRWPYKRMGWSNRIRSNKTADVSTKYDMFLEMVSLDPLWAE